MNPRIPVDEVPVYEGKGAVRDGGVSETVESLKRRSPASDAEFARLWARYGGLELNGVACVIDEELCHTVLTDILATIVSSGISCNNVDIAKLYPLMGVDSEGYDEPLPVVAAVLRMFSESSGKRIRDYNKSDMTNSI